MGAELTSKAVGKLQLHDTFDVFEVKEVEYNGKTLQRLKVKSGRPAAAFPLPGGAWGVLLLKASRLAQVSPREWQRRPGAPRTLGSSTK